MKKSHKNNHSLISSNITSAEMDELTSIISAYFGIDTNIVFSEYQRHDLFITTLRLYINETEYCAFYGLPSYCAINGFIDEIIKSRCSLVLPIVEASGTTRTSLCRNIPATLVLIESDAELTTRVSEATHEVWVQNAYKEEFINKR